VLSEGTYTRSHPKTGQFPKKYPEANNGDSGAGALRQRDKRAAELVAVAIPGGRAPVPEGAGTSLANLFDLAARSGSATAPPAWRNPAANFQCNVRYRTD
jgi:hypothetical protein